VIATESAAPPLLIVGAGHGCRVHLPAARHAGFAVVGLVGSDSGRVRRAADRNAVSHAFTDLDVAITQTGAVAVTIASPPLTHASLVLTALARGCHVLCEKPFARDSAEARTLLAAANKAGVVHVLGTQMRTLPQRVVVARALAEGLIGEPRFATFAQYVSMVADLGATWPPRWWFDKDAGGGWLNASGSHMIDMIRSWLGEFATVSAALPILSERENVAEDSFAVRFRMRSGVQGVLQQTGGAWGPFADIIRVAGSRGTVWIEDGVPWVADRDGTRRLPVPAELRLEEMAPSEDPRKALIHIELPPSRRLFEHWHAAIEGRSVSTGVPYATFSDGVACKEVIEAIRASAANGGALVSVARC